MVHHTQVSINLRAFEENISVLKSLLPPACRLCAVVKADAYGHGLDDLAPAAHRAGVNYLGITDNWEAEQIHRLGISCPILRLRPALPDEVEEAAVWNVEEVIGDSETATALSQLGLKRGKPLPVHVKLNCGVNRMSFSFPLQKAEIKRIGCMPGLEIRGVMTHFPAADDEEIQTTLDQWDGFESAVREISNFFPPAILIHAANSAAALRIPRSHGSMVRLGIILYGIKPSALVPAPSQLKPVMSWKTVVVQIRDVLPNSTIGYGMTYKTKRHQRIATLPMGYADGYLRAFSNRAEVLIRGKRCPVVGRVSMDMTTVDVTHAPEIRVGDEVILMGKQEDEFISAEELAEKAGTIAYEITCLVGKCNRVRSVIDKNQFD